MEPTAADRCDRCGARAYWIAEKITGETLKFCNHHGEKHKYVLSDSGFILNNYSYILRNGIKDDQHVN